MSSPSLGDRKDHMLKKHNSIARKISESSWKKPKRLNPVSSHWCGHCDKRLSLKVFKKHQKLYMRLDQAWIASGSDLVDKSTSSSGQ